MSIHSNTYFRLMDRYSFIEGVGDEVVVVFGIAIVIVLILCLYNYLELSTGKSSTSPPLRPHTGPHSETCPICLEILTYPIQTNCGHNFCGSCMLRMWDHSQWLLSPAPCAMCRQTITLIFLNFNEAEVSSVSSERPGLVTKIGEYNRRFSGAPRPVLDYIYDVPTLFRQMFSDRGLNLIMRFRIYFYFGLALLYLITPVDILPESVFGIAGILDDLIVIIIIAVYVTSLYRNYVAFRNIGHEFEQPSRE